MRADVGEICLPPVQVVCFLRMADWQMLIVCMHAHSMQYMSLSCISSGVFFISCRPRLTLWRVYDLLVTGLCGVGECATDLRNNMLFRVLDREA